MIHFFTVQIFDPGQSVICEVGRPQTQLFISLPIKKIHVSDSPEKRNMRHVHVDWEETLINDVIGDRYEIIPLQI